MLERGRLYRFSYLWSWQFERGEESGRKVRPVCLVFKTSKATGNLFLFPVTTAPPPQDRLAVEIPPEQWKVAGLNAKCWIMLDEYNQTTESTAYDFDSFEPIGQFGDRFLLEIAETVRNAILAGRMKAVKRT